MAHNLATCFDLLLSLRETCICECTDARSLKGVIVAYRRQTAIINRRHTCQAVFFLLKSVISRRRLPTIYQHQWAVDTKLSHTHTHTHIKLVAFPQTPPTQNSERVRVRLPSMPGMRHGLRDTNCHHRDLLIGYRTRSNRVCAHHCRQWSPIVWWRGRTLPLSP